MEICGCMVTYNEAENVEMAIESSKEICDRMVIVDDGSTDNTVELIKQSCEKHRLDYNLIRRKYTGMIHDTRDLALKNCKGDWILVTDGDFIWHTSGRNNVKGLKSLAKKYNNQNVHLYFPLAFLYGDYWHTLTNRPIGYPHPYFIKNNKSLHCVKDKRFFRYTTKQPIIKKSSNTIYGFHAGGVKSARMLMYRRFWTPWREYEKFKKWPTAWDYVRYCVGDNIKLASCRYFRDYMKAFSKYDTTKHGYYPYILKQKMKRPNKCLRLLHNKSGNIIGRSDIGRVDKLTGSFKKREWPN